MVSHQVKQWDIAREMSFAMGSGHAPVELTLEAVSALLKARGKVVDYAAVRCYVATAIALHSGTVLPAPVPMIDILSLTARERDNVLSGSLAVWADEARQNPAFAELAGIFDRSTSWHEVSAILSSLGTASKALRVLALFVADYCGEAGELSYYFSACWSQGDEDFNEVMKGTLVVDDVAVPVVPAVQKTASGVQLARRKVIDIKSLMAREWMPLSELAPLADAARKNAEVVEIASDMDSATNWGYAADELKRCTTASQVLQVMALLCVDYTDPDDEHSYNYVHEVCWHLTDTLFSGAMGQIEVIDDIDTEAVLQVPAPPSSTALPLPDNRQLAAAYADDGFTVRRIVRVAE
jgi:hypothetical protein